jgi:hypothetical protein
MFRLLVGIIILGLVGVVIGVGIKIGASIMKDREKKSADNNSLDVDKIINDLELKIEIAELQASKGVADAERDLEKYKSDLEKAKKIKQKLNN